MIECTENNIWYKKKHCKITIKQCFKSLIIFSIIIGLFTYYRTVTCKCVFNICHDYVYSYCTEAVNLAILESLEDELLYSDVINIEKNNDGEIILLNANAIKINSINKNIATATTTILKNKLSNGVPIPLLAFSGVNILSGYGSIIHLKTLSISSVSCEFDSKFSAVGVNQTLHSIYIIVNAKVDLNMPLYNEAVHFSTPILISEAVLVGKVPNFHFNGSLFK